MLSGAINVAKLLCSIAGPWWNKTAASWAIAHCNKNERENFMNDFHDADSKPTRELVTISSSVSGFLPCGSSWTYADWIILLNGKLDVKWTRVFQSTETLLYMQRLSWNPMRVNKSEYELCKPIKPHCQVTWKLKFTLCHFVYAMKMLSGSLKTSREISVSINS